MTCQTCGDRGVVRVNWKDADEDYAVCLCLVGAGLRSTTNAGKPCEPGWRVWAAQRSVHPDRITMLEDVLTPDELAVKGFQELSAASAMDAIVAAAQARSPR